MCTHVGPFKDGSLICDRTTIHDEDAEAGHTYSTSDGSCANDKHRTDGGHG